MNNLTKTSKLPTLSMKEMTSLTPESYLNSLSLDQIGLVFSQLDSIEKFVAGVRKLIENNVKEGVAIPGVQLALVQSKPTEGFIASEEVIAKKLNEMGYSNDIIYKPQSLVSWTTIKNLVKTSGVNELKEAGLVGKVEKDPVEKVIYVGLDENSDN